MSRRSSHAGQDIASNPVDPADASKGFSLVFRFASNPFFEPLELTKTCARRSDVERSGSRSDVGAFLLSIVYPAHSLHTSFVLLVGEV